MPRSDPPRRSVRFALYALPVALLVFGQVLPSSGELGSPQQIHLSWSGPSEAHVTVSWVTSTSASDSQVAFALSSEPETEVPELRVAPLPDDPGLYAHTAVFGPLDPGKTYRYRVGKDSTGWSSSFRLRTPASGPKAFTFAAAADMGVGGRAEANVARMVEADPDLVLFAGDLSYAWGHPWRWNRFFQMIQPLATSALFMTAPGNHEHTAPLGIRSYLERLALPQNERYYSFDYGPLHVIALDSGSEYAGPTEEITSWLEADLRRAEDDPRRPWKVAFFHFPPFTSGGHGSWMEGRTLWSPLFDRYGVSLVIGGHSHLYERSWPVDATGEVASMSYDEPVAPVYVVTGGGGAKLYGFNPEQPAWSAFRASEYQTLLVTVEGDRMTVDAVRPDGSRLDTFTLVRGNSSRSRGNGR